MCSRSPKHYGAPVTRKVLRALSPAGFLLTLLCFALPFVTVSCDAPGGYGRSAPGGFTSYTGFDLATGEAPDVDPQHLRPAAEQRDDRFDPQPFAIAALLALVAGIVTVVIRETAVRRIAAALCAGAAGAMLLANQAVTEALVEARLNVQLTVPMPAGKSATDYVHTGNGWGGAVLLSVVLLAGNLAGWWRRRRDSPGGPA
jgi:hypothetical protein